MLPRRYVVVAEQVRVDRPDPDALLARAKRAQRAVVVDRVPGDVQSDARAAAGEPVDEGRVVRCAPTTVRAAPGHG